MTVADIQNQLKRKFNNHKYELCNSYIFNWECDFFSISNSGYAYEVEIKLSRSDFFADFKKEKHKVFSLVTKGKTWYWENDGRDKYGGSILGRIATKKLTRRTQYGRNLEELEPGVIYDWKTDTYIGNQWDAYRLELEYTRDIHAPCTRINYVDLTKVNIPHRFFYACPEGLIKPKEVPEYAGLIYIKEWPGEDFTAFSEQTIKPAPFIHKRPMDLNSILLNKFYYECRDLRFKVWQHEQKSHVTLQGR